MGFDIDGARKAGYSDDQIADYLAGQKGIDVAAARKAGYTTDRLMVELSDAFVDRTPSPEQSKPAAPSAGLSSVRRGGTRAEAKPYVAADPAITSDPLAKPAPAELRQPMIEQRGAPVSDELVKTTVAQLSAMPRAQRQAQAKRTDLPGWMQETVRRAVEQIDGADAGAQRVGMTGPSLEARTARLMRDGADQATATARATTDAQRGAEATGLPQMTAGQGLLTADEQNANRAEGLTMGRKSLAERGLYGAKEGLVQGTAGLIAMGLRAAGDEETAKFYEKVGQGASVRAQAANELSVMQEKARDAGILPSGPLSGAADYMERMGTGAANSIGQMLPGIATGLATGSAGAGLAMMALPVFGQSYIDKRDAGGSPGMSAAYGGAMAALEIIGERYGLLPQALNAFKKEAAKKSLEEVPAFIERGIAAMEKRGLFSKPVAAIARGQAGEQFGEQITGAGQYLLDGTAFGLDKPISLMGFIENARDTAVQTLLATGVMQAGGAAAKRAMRGTQVAEDPDATDRPASAPMAQPIPQRVEPTMDAAAQSSSPAQVENNASAPMALSTGAPAEAPAAAQNTAQPEAQPAAQAVDNITGILQQAGALPQDFTGLDEAPRADAPTPEPAPVEGEKINRNWSAFAPESGTLGIPRSDMPQIGAEHRGAFVNFLAGRGIERTTEEVPADSLQPTQAEFSPRKVAQARERTGGDRSILVSADGYVIDGHHQWAAAREEGKPVKVIRFNAPINDLLRLGHQFPSSYTAPGPKRTTTTEATDGNLSDAGGNENRGPADGSAGAGVGNVVQGEQPAAASDGPATGVGSGADERAGAVQPGPGRGHDALTAGATFTLDGKTWTVREVKDSAVGLVDADGKPRMVARNGATFQKIKAALQPTEHATEGPGSNAGNGFKQGPKKGERYRVGIVAAAGGAVSLEKRLPAGTAATFYVGKDGNLIDGDSVNFIGAGRESLWIPATAEQSQQAQSILDEMGRLDLNDPARKDAKARLKALVLQEKKAALQPAATATEPATAEANPVSQGAQSDEVIQPSNEVGVQTAGLASPATTTDSAREQAKPQVYKTKDAASKAAKEAGNTLKVQKVKDGFILRQKTDKELAAEHAAGSRLRRGAGVDVENDSLLAAIAKLGGIDMSERADTIGSGNKNIGGKMLFRNGGKSIDTLANEALHEFGYIPPEEHASDGGVRWLRDAIAAEFMGTRTHHSQRGESWMERAQAEAALRYEEPDPLADFTADDLTAEGYTGPTPEQQHAIERLLIDAAASGIDTEALVEDVARATEGKNTDDYHAALKEAVDQAIAGNRGSAEGPDARAARGSNSRDGKAAGTQGQEQGRGSSKGQAEGLTLEAQTAEDLKSKTDREAAALRAEKAKKDSEQARLKKEAEARDDKARADQTVNDFQLGQSAEQQMSGMGDLFAAQAPAAAPSPDDPAPATRIEAGDTEAMRQAKADLMAGLGDLAALLSKNTRANITPEQEQALLPILTRVMDAALRMGHLKFKQAARFVLEQIRAAIGNEVADLITLDHLQGAYIGMAGKYRDQGADRAAAVAAVESLADITAGDNQAQESDHVPSAGPNLERNRADAGGEAPAVGGAVPDGARADAVGAEPVGEPAFDAGGRRPNDPGVRAGGPAADGAPGDSAVSQRDEQRDAERGDARADNDPRGGGFGDERVPAEPVAAADADRAADAGVRNSVRLTKQRAADRIELKPGDLENIRATLPYLLPGQQEDVKKAEDRFAKVDGYGMLFTNGTGTGKTFTGLGIVKRFARQGKTNTLIVVPSDKIAEDWIESGKALGLTIGLLPDTKGAGKGIVITTYAALGMNDSLADRRWDLVVTDEAHYLMQDKDGTETRALQALRAITMHPRGATKRAEMRHRDLLEKAQDLAERSRLARTSDDERNWHAAPAMEAEEAKAWADWKAAQEAMQAEVMANQGLMRPRLAALSFTPFAYDKTIDWAEGYLFDYSEGQEGQNLASGSGAGHGYNSGDWRDKFFMQHLGYRMRYNKLTAPDAKVDTGLMQRQFNTWLKQRGVLSGRMLDVAADYDRRFVLVDSAIGHQIDAALAWLQDHTVPGRSALAEKVNEQFDYLSRRYLLEAIKAEESIPIIVQHLQLGRKVVVFHDYKKGGGFNPFNLSLSPDAKADTYGPGMKPVSVPLGPMYAEFKAKFADLMAYPFNSLGSAIDTFKAQLPDVILFNGDVSPKDRRAAVKEFQSDERGPAVMLVQTDAGKVGISLHDTTGKHQRVLINLGQPVQPTTAMQQEGRIYRTGQVSNAIIRYLNTGTNWEKWAFATTIATRASAAENLGSGELARAIKDAFIAGYEESDTFAPGHEGEGTGGKARDSAANNAISEYDRAKAFYWATQKKNARTKAQEGSDYFATPEPLGLKMAQWLDLRPGETAVEPSAGHGAIARWLRSDAKRIAIEPSSALVPRLAMVFDGEILRQQFEDWHVNNKADGVAMNPPFGSAGRTAIDHLAKAATHLRDGGRIVALIPTGPAADAKFDKWFYEKAQRPVNPVAEHPTLGPIYRGDVLSTNATWAKTGTVVSGGSANSYALMLKVEGQAGTSGVTLQAVQEVVKRGPRTVTYMPAEGLHLVADIKLPQITFERAGTGVSTRVMVIEKPMEGQSAPQQISRDYTDITDINELFDRLENLDLKPRAKPVEEAPADVAPTAASAAASPAAKAEAKKQASAEGAAAAEGAGMPLVEHVTAKGKTLRGVIRKDLSQAQAKEIDAYTFKKDGGWFIRAEHVPAMMEKAPPKFSRSGRTGRGISITDAEAIAADIRATMPTAPQIVVVESVSQLPDKLRMLIEQAGADNDVEGVYWGGKVYAVTSHFSDLDRFRFVVAHHELRHHGFGAMLGPRLHRMMMQIYRSNAKVRELADKNIRDGIAKDVVVATEEALADMPVEDLVKLNFWASLKAAVREFLRNLAIKLEKRHPKLADMLRPEGWTDEDIARLISRAEDMSRTGEPDYVRGGAVFAQAWHGTPHRGIEKFSTDKIGTGEGAQAYGWGLYFASKQEIAEHYRKTLSEQQGTVDGAMLDPTNPLHIAAGKLAETNGDRTKAASELREELNRLHLYPDGAGPIYAQAAALLDSDARIPEYKIAHGQLYAVDIPEDSEMLLWDKPLSEQPAKVRKVLQDLLDLSIHNIPSRVRYMAHDGNEKIDPKATGEMIYRAMQDGESGGQRAVSVFLLSRGIKGIKYLDGTSRDGSGDSHNYVIFSGDDVQITQAMFSRARPKHDARTTEALARAGIRPSATWREKVGSAFGSALDVLRDRDELLSTARQLGLDQFHGIDRAVKRDIGNLPTEQDPYVAARLANGATSAVMRAILLHGQARWTANGQHLEKIPGTKGLLDILAPLGEDVHDWFGWMIGNRAARLMKEGREHNFTPDQIAALQALATPEKKGAFQKAALEYAAFKRSVLDVAQMAGLINPETRKSWDYADYIPFYRQMDNSSLNNAGGHSRDIGFKAVGRKGLSGQSSGIRTLKGGTASLNDPIENLLMNFSRLIDASLKNNAIRSAVDALSEAGSEAVHKVGYDFAAEVIPADQVRKRLIEAGTPEPVLDAIPPEAFDGMAKMWAIKQPADPDVVRVMVDGKPQFYRVNDALLLRALTSFTPFNFPGLGIMRGAKRLLTSMVTSTPDFIVRNFIRDTAATQAIARDGFSPHRAIAGMVKSYRETGAAEAMLFAGASFGSGQVNAADPAGTAAEIRRALRARGMSAAGIEGFMASLLDTPARVWEKWRDITDAVENANREAVYEAAVKGGRSLTAAAFESKDLMDFSLRGSAAAYQLLADVLPFFNARVQGLYRLGRADPKRLAAVGAIITVASLLLAMANDGEDWYEELPDWDKDTSWHFRIGGHHFRIPKPFEVGVAFATIPERIGRSIKGLDTGKKTMSRLWSNVRDQLAIDPVPQLVRPVLNVWGNHDTFRDSPIETQRDEGKQPAQRYDARTSDTMRVLANAAEPMANATGLSPKRLEYLVNGYLGTVGSYALGLSDMVVRKLEGKPPGPSLRADDIPLVKSFYRVDPARSTVYESDLYKVRQEVSEIYRSVSALKKDQPELAVKKATAEQDKLALRGVVTHASNQLAALRRQADAIYLDPVMSPEEKRRQLDAIQAQKNAVSRGVMTLPAIKEAF